ncbi:MAG: energy transducer TonB [Myxococcota bacterium]
MTTPPHPGSSSAPPTPQRRRDRESDVLIWLVSAVLVSVFLHATSYVVLAAVPRPSFEPTEPSVVDFEVEPPPPEEEVVEEVPEEEPEPEIPEPEPEPPPRPPPRAQTPDPPPPDEPPPPPPPAEETPVAFDNLTLTNDSGDSSFAVPESSGIDREGPIGPPGEPTGRRRAGVPGGVPGGTGAPSGARGPRVVGVSDLSRRPTAQGNHNALLSQFYPSEARAQGREGRGRARIRILPSGAVRVLRTEGSGEFASACTRMLRSGQVRFRPPLDRQGNPVAFDTTYSCDFRVRF